MLPSTSSRVGPEGPGASGSAAADAELEVFRGPELVGRGETAPEADRSSGMLRRKTGSPLLSKLRVIPELAAPLEGAAAAEAEALVGPAEAEGGGAVAGTGMTSPDESVDRARGSRRS